MYNMGIEKIRNNFDAAPTSKNAFAGQIARNRVYLGEIKDTTSFTGAQAAATEKVSDILLKLFPGKIRVMLKAHENMGEIQNQMINAVGTGFVAPLFIKFNPMSDTDENTRTYTAWRQPVSAVLAVATQCAIVKPFNDLIRWMSDIGYLGQNYNKTLAPSNNYIEKLIKEQNPNKKYTKEELKAEVESIQKQKEKALEKMISNNEIIFDKTSRKGGKTVIEKAPMSENDFKQLVSDTIDSIINSEETQKLEATTLKTSKKMERALFYNKNAEDSRKVLERISNKINNEYTEADFSTDKIKSIHTELNKEFKEIIKELKTEAKADPSKKETNAELIKIVKGLKSRNIGNEPETIRIMKYKVDDMLGELNIVSAKKSTSEIVDYINKKIARRTNAIDSVISTLSELKTKLLNSEISISQAQEVINEKIKASTKAVEEKLKAQGITGEEIFEHPEYKESLASRMKQKIGSLAGSVRKQLAKNQKANIDAAQRWTGLFVSLAILPVTCWMLNKIYPWFMDLAFPNLSNKKDVKPTENEKKVEVK